MWIINFPMEYSKGNEIILLFSLLQQLLLIDNFFNTYKIEYDEIFFSSKKFEIMILILI